MLFKEKYFKHFMEGLSNEVLILAENSVMSVFIIWDITANYFYEIGIGKVINSIEKNLVRKDFLDKLNLPLSEDFYKQIGTKNFDRFVARVFDYYYSRLPVLLNKGIHRQGKKRLSKQEVEMILDSCFYKWASKYPEMGKSYKFSGDYSTFDKLMRWPFKQFRQKFCDDKIYENIWIRRELENLYPYMLEETNINDFAIYILDSSFPMFWNKMNDRYIQAIFYSANFGHFVGDKDIEELGESLKKRKH